jgi:protein-tyrosine phosphatase
MTPTTEPTTHKTTGTTMPTDDATSPPLEVLVVCTANIARSPLFAAMLAARAGDGVRVTSAGVRAREDDGAAEGSQLLGRARGLDLAAHRSRPVTAELIAASDLVLTMSERQRDRCAPLAAQAASRVFTVREFARLVARLDRTGAPTDPAGLLRWLRDQAHLARPRTLPAAGKEDVADPIQATWPEWETMAADLDDLLDRILLGTRPSGT